MVGELSTAVRRLTRRQVAAATAAATALLVVAALSGWTLLRRDDGNTVEAYIARSSLAEQRELRIGVFGDEPLLSYRDPAKPDSDRLEDYSGFDIEMARRLGAYLGFRPASVKLAPTQVQNRARDLNEGLVDIVIANYSMTPERELEVDFSGPYLRTMPEVLMRAKDAPPSITFQALGGMAGRICTTGSSTSEAALNRKGIRQVDGVGQAQECVRGLLNGKYDAFVLDEVVLAGFRKSHPQLALVDLVFDQAEYYGIAVANGNAELKTLVDNFLLDSYERGDNGAWHQAWSGTLGQVVRRQQVQPRPVVSVKLRDYNDRRR
ncbi:transporter substrate-binding domain-containing protein [Pilimelia columellifera]|uniref:Solute-binding protein family 3/N-terminal domain-containing protein n=1 Tax=Pilimelia columellifera subsp. columellifera TaxID=706583 RepID=A0ABP6AY52_9ACTN